MILFWFMTDYARNSVLVLDQLRQDWVEIDSLLFICPSVLNVRAVATWKKPFAFTHLNTWQETRPFLCPTLDLFFWYFGIITLTKRRNSQFLSVLYRSALRGKDQFQFKSIYQGWALDERIIKNTYEESHHNCLSCDFKPLFCHLQKRSTTLKKDFWLG